MSKETTETKAADTDTEEVDEEESEAQVEEENGETDEDEEETEETVAKADLDKVQKALESERAIKKEQASEIRRLKRELKAAQEKTPDDVDSQKLVAEGDKRGSEFKDIAVRKEATLGLTEAGAKVSTARLIKLLDLADVEIDDNGNVDGLADAISELKEESPEFFKSDDDEEKPTTTKKVTVRKPGSVDGGTKTPPQQKPLSAAEQMAKLAAGKRG